MPERLTLKQQLQIKQLRAHPPWLRAISFRIGLMICIPRECWLVIKDGVHCTYRECKAAVREIRAASEELRRRVEED